MSNDQQTDLIPRLRAALERLVAAVERDDNPVEQGHSSTSDEMREARDALAASSEGRPQGWQPIALGTDAQLDRASDISRRLAAAISDDPNMRDHIEHVVFGIVLVELRREG
jgi:hypothetical protein